MKIIDLAPFARPEWFQSPELYLPSRLSGGNLIIYSNVWSAPASISRGAEFRLTRVPE